MQTKIWTIRPSSKEFIFSQDFNIFISENLMWEEFNPLVSMMADTWKNNINIRWVYINKSNQVYSANQWNEQR